MQECKTCKKFFSPKTKEQIYCDGNCASRDNAWVLKADLICAGETATDADTFSLSEAAWQEAYNRVIAGGTTVCEIYSRGEIYTLSYVKGAIRLGYISEDREGRIWQCTDSDDQRIELDPARGGSFMRY